MKRVAILQSNYIPWKGYFDFIESVDAFVLYDEMQYTRRDWRNRNKIKTKDGTKWLTVPVSVKGKYLQKISETAIDDPHWAADHLVQLRHAYARAPHFRSVWPWLEDLYVRAPATTISAVNVHFLRAICERLEIATPLLISSDFELLEGKTERLVGICSDLGATEYVSGPAAKDYVERSLFESAGIALRWKSYAGYPVYPQLGEPFEPGVTILDLFFNLGDETRAYLHSTPTFED